MQVNPGVRPLNQIALPTIIPTTFSVRHMGDRQDAHRPKIPSSPPLSNGNESVIPTAMRACTPTPRKKTERVKKTEDTPRTPMQLSSPPGSPLKKSTARRIKDGRGKYGGLTSSVVKGEAASGLMELMKRSNGNSVD